MRPIKLVMNAFGPYKDRVEVDFNQLGRNGIFLITGDTGSGKTMIFDAISFSLFGEASGSRRDNSCFRSDFARDEVRTFVELTFEHKEVLYQIERIPRYMRKKVRGDGMTTVGGDASLVFLDQVVTGDKNVTDKCIEILGMNASQFKQIMMIAQGEFMDLLLSKPKDRASIFRRVFNTEIFKDISDQLKEKYLEKKREYEDCCLSVEHYINGIIFKDGTVLNKNMVDIMRLLNQEIQNDEKREQKLEEEKEKLTQESLRYVEQISEGKFIKESLNSLKENQILLKQMLRQEEEIQTRKKKVQQSKVILERVSPKADEVNRTNEKIQEKEKKLQLTEKEYQEFLIQLNDAIEQYSLLDNKNQKLDYLKNEKRIYEEKLPILQEIKKIGMELEEKRVLFSRLHLKELEQLLDDINEKKRLENDIRKLEEQFILLQKDYTTYNQKYVCDYHLFLNAQAGILASKLEDHSPCPVCGSLEHPKKAVMEEIFLTKEELDHELEELEEKRGELDGMSAKIHQQKMDFERLQTCLLEISEDSILLERQKLLDSGVENGDVSFEIENIDSESLSQEISKLEVLWKSKKESLNDDEIDEEELLGKIGQVQEKIDNLEKEIVRIQQDYENYISKKSSLESVLELTKKELVELRKDFLLKNQEYISSYQELGYLKEEDYLACCLEREVVEEYEGNIKEYEENLKSVQEKISTLQEVIKGKSVVDLEQLENQKCQIDTKIQEIDLSLKDINNKLSNNIKIFDKVKNVSQKTTKLEKEVMIYKDLSDTANGTIKGCNKLEFEQFVQASYFNQVIESANQRFRYMTEERYQLVRKEEAVKISDQLGLELEVMDYYTGKRRDIKSLSGGESFKAALSLALGMSDTIQQMAGGVVVDAMFIDEGFGSLDDESLDASLNAIMMLSQGTRMIGIISHVNELRSRIDQKIIVKKSSSGSSVSVVT